jgi:hypothetical protein
MVVNRMCEWSENHDRSKGNDGRTEFGRCFIRDLEIIAEVFRLCVPPAAMKVQDNGEEGPCPIPGKWSIGDAGLAQQLVGRLRVASSEYSSLVLEASVGNGGGGGSGVGDVGDDSAGRSLVHMLVSSIKRCAAAPWLVPVNRGYFEADRRGDHGDASCATENIFVQNRDAAQSSSQVILCSLAVHLILTRTICSRLSRCLLED